MTATNHAISGALIGLGLADLVYAIPVAFLYHFAQDAVPHYDPPGATEAEQIRTPRFKHQIQIDAALCGMVVLALLIFRPHHWLIAIISAFVCALPDLFWLPRWVAARKGRPLPRSNAFWKFHWWFQWCAGSELWWVEAAWFVVFGGLLAISI